VLSSFSARGGKKNSLSIFAWARQSAACDQAFDVFDESIIGTPLGNLSVSSGLKSGFVKEGGVGTLVVGASRVLKLVA
jgi:hypothetical protein